MQLLTPEALLERLHCAGNHESCVIRWQNWVLFGKPLKQDYLGLGVRRSCRSLTNASPRTSGAPESKTLP
jgi:hypothetical protein